MIRRTPLAFLWQALLFLALGLYAPAQTLGRYLDSERPAGDGVRLVVFNPEVSNIRALAALRKRGILDVPALTVIGMFHTRQKDDFENSARYVLENGLDWFKFHTVSADISESVLFRRNACTPEFEAILRNADGVIFFGGPDIPASIYRERTNLLTVIEDPYRHFLEISAVFHLLGGTQETAFPPLLAARPGFPVLGICLGFQSLNVGTGGTLIQDIWAELYGKNNLEDVVAMDPEGWHNNPFRRLFPLDKLMSYNFHTLQLGRKNKFTVAMGFQPSDHPRVLSSHHQAIRALAKGWKAVATSRDGKIIEAIEHMRFPNVLGVQFHPENALLWETEPRFRQKPGDPLTSYNAILAGAPPSLEFNRAIWAWLAARLKESRRL